MESAVAWIWVRYVPATISDPASIKRHNVRSSAHILRMFRAHANHAKRSGPVAPDPRVLCSFRLQRIMFIHLALQADRSLAGGGGSCSVTAQ